METKKWFCLGCSASYGTLHGMYEWDFIEDTEENARLYARELAEHVCDSYSDIYEGIEDNAHYLEENEGWDYDEAYEEYFNDELEYSIFEVRADVDIEELRQTNHEPSFYIEEYCVCQD